MKYLLVLLLTYMGFAQPSMSSIYNPVGCWIARYGVTQSSNLVTQWNDLSVTGAHLTATGAVRPDYVASGINSYPVISFDGTTYLRAKNGLGFSGANPEMTVLIVASVDDAGSQKRIVQIGDSTNTPKTLANIGFSAYGSSNTDERASFRYNGSNLIFGNTDLKGWSLTLWHYVTNTVSGELWVNDTTQASTAQGSSTSVTLADHEIMVGVGRTSAGSLGEYLQGDVFAVIIWAGDLTDAQKTSVFSTINCLAGQVYPDASCSTDTATKPGSPGHNGYSRFKTY